jgi:hypothetical protein
LTGKKYIKKETFTKNVLETPEKYKKQKTKEEEGVCCRIF